MNKLKNNKEFMEYRKERGKMLLSRRNQLLLEFSFWNEPVPRQGPNIYELRSYQLRPGTMIEWGNYWARAIRYRQHNREAVGGFFSQIGNLYMVHHLWAYKDLKSRESTRNAAWQHEGWNEVVYYTGNFTASIAAAVFYYLVCLTLLSLFMRNDAGLLHSRSSQTPHNPILQRVFSTSGLENPRTLCSASPPSLSLPPPRTILRW
ncbi:hypothetical protein NFI96_026206 [Prochilodus magdalenae]|nr:hypothetical protein NFI96_026206 [Prochilodus magdalenae]